MYDFIYMKSPWCLVYVIATNASGNHELHILSHHRKDQMGHYYLIESTAQEVLIFRFQHLARLGNNLFAEQRRSNLMSKLREYRLFANISPDYVNGEVAHLVIVPRICLKPPHEEYSTMEVNVLNTHFYNLPKVDPTSALNDTQPFAASFINANIDIIVDL